MIEVVLGPAFSGKTNRLLGYYRELLTQLPPGSLLWLAPTEKAASDIRFRLLNKDLAACLSPNIMTFERFADTILQHSDITVHRLSSHQSRFMIQELIQQANQEAALKYFQPIVETNGLVQMVAQFIGELKRNEIWPDDFRQACERRGLNQKDRELLLLYESYQKRLNQYQLYDAEGRFWSARTFLRENQTRYFDQLQYIFADGFTDFTWTQHEILEILAKQTKQLTITLPLDVDQPRSDLFNKPQRTLESFQQTAGRLGDLKTHFNVVKLNRNRLDFPSEEDKKFWPAIAHLESQLFGDPRKSIAATDTQGIEIIQAPQQVGEIKLIAQRIKQLLTSATAQPAIQPQQIAVVFRSLTTISPLVDEIFEQFGIPFSLESNSTLSHSPLIKTLLLLFQLKKEDWPYRLLLSLLSNNYFNPNLAMKESEEVRNNDDSHHSQELPHHPIKVAAERFLREVQITKGRKELFYQLESLSKNVNHSAGSHEDSMDEIDHQQATQFERLCNWAMESQPLFETLANAIDALPDKASLQQWSDAVVELCTQLGLINADEDNGKEGDREAVDHVASDDRIALHTLCELLISIDQLYENRIHQPLSVSFSQFTKIIATLIHSATLSQTNDPSGCVQVLSAPFARNLSFDYLFFAGLSEKAFPPAEQDNLVYNNRQRQQLIDQQLRLTHQHDRGPDEMLLFYEVITRARKKLYLSYPALDEKAQPLLPSPYLNDVQQAMGIGTIKTQEVIDLSPVPSDDQPPLSISQWRVQSVSQAADGQTGLLTALLQNPETNSLANNILAGISSNDSRQRGRNFDCFEGMFQSQESLVELFDQFGPHHVWSASQLENYAHCPYQFFMQRILKLAPLETLSLETDYLTRGRVLHDVLASTHRSINEKQTEPTALSDEIIELFTELFHSHLDGELSNLKTWSDFDKAVNEIERRMLSRASQNYLQQHQKYQEIVNKQASIDQENIDLAPAHFEVSFGLKIEKTSHVDQLSTAQPLVVGEGKYAIKISGRVDRIDVGKIQEQMFFSILDYKSGKGKSRDQAQMQLDLYTIATQEVLFKTKAILPLLSGYWFIGQKGFQLWEKMSESMDNSFSIAGSWKSRREQIIQTVQSIVKGIRSGEFPMISSDLGCTSQCPYSTICRVNQTRSLEKLWQLSQDEANDE